MGRDKGSRRRRAARWLSGSSLTPRPGGPLTEDTAGSEAEALHVPYERHGAWGATGAQGEADSEWGTQEAPRRPPTGREVDTEPAGGQQRAPHGGSCAEGGGSVRTRRPARASLPHVRGRAAARGPGPPDASPAASGPSTDAPSFPAEGHTIFFSQIHVQEKQNESSSSQCAKLCWE